MKAVTTTALALLIANFSVTAFGPAVAEPDQSKNRESNWLTIEPSGPFIRALTRSAVKEVQEALNRKGFDAGRPDGVWGPRTAGALRDFQERNRFQVSGRLDKRTVAELGLVTDAPTTGSIPSTTGQGPGREW